MVGRWWRIPVVGSMVAAFGLAVPAAAQTKKLGTFGGWAIGIVQDKGRFVRCVADTPGGAQNEGLRLSFADDATRHLIVSAPGAATGAKEQATVVLHPSGRRFIFAMVQGTPDRLSGPVLESCFTDVFFDSKRMEVQFPARNVTRSFDLGDPDTMSARIDGCMSSQQ